MIVERIHLDKRSIVSGKKSVLHTQNPFNLNNHIGLVTNSILTNGGYLFNVGLGLTETPVGTVKLGGSGIGSGEDLNIAANEIWQVSDTLTVADTVSSLTVGTHPTFGIPAVGLITEETNGNLAAITTLGDGTVAYASMTQNRGTTIKKVTLENLELSMSNNEPTISLARIILSTDTISMGSIDHVNVDSTLIETNKDKGVIFNGVISGVAYSYEHPRSSGLINQVLLNDGAGQLNWSNGPSAMLDNIYTADGALTGNRIISCAGLNLTFDNPNYFIVDGAAILDINGAIAGIVGSTSVTVGSTTSLRLSTPAVTATSVTVGEIPVLQNINGEIEFETLVKGAYADDTAAGVGGITTGQLYQTTGTAAAPLNVVGIVMIKQ